MIVSKINRQTSHLFRTLNRSLKKNFNTPIAHNPNIAGGLFHPGDESQEIAFRFAVDTINRDKSILPRSKLVVQIERISAQDSFHASKRGKLFLNRNDNNYY